MFLKHCSVVIDELSLGEMGEENLNLENFRRKFENLNGGKK